MIKIGQHTAYNRNPIAEYYQNRKNVEIVNFSNSFYLSGIKLAQLCYGCMQATLLQKMYFLHKKVETMKKSNQCHMSNVI